ncbi:MAG: metallopeptidase family protein [Phycisphaerales bacterium]
MNAHDRDRFDDLVDDAIGALPARLQGLLDEMPIIVLDRPTPEMLADLGMRPEEATDLCGLHTGVSFTERSIEADGTIPTQIHLFREGILSAAGGWRGPVAEEIRITLLHEIGHQMGLEEEDLDDLGYA